MLSACDLGWIAGIVEGEGCFAYSWGSAEARLHRRNIGSVHLKIAMTDRDVMERLRVLMGAPRELYMMPRKAHYKTQYRVDFTGRRAIEWAFTLYPLLGERRRAKIRQLVAQWKTQRGHSRDRTECPRGHPLSGPNLMLSPRRNGRTARMCRQCELVRQARLRERNRPAYRHRDRQRHKASYWRRKQATAREMGQSTLF